MKKIIISLLIIVLTVAATITSVNAQCRQQMVYSCATQTNSIYLRDFNTKLRREAGGETGTKWTVVLNKDAHYRFNLCTPEGFEDKVVLTLYDPQHPELTDPYGSTYNQATNQIVTSFDFVCRKSGMYYVSIRFIDGRDDDRTCAVGILSFVSSGN